jgi:hypothetical protein
VGLSAITTLVVYGSTKWWWHNGAAKSTVSDPQVLVATFITLYGLFIAGFGALATFVTRGRYRRVWQVLAVALLIGATALDLYRVLDSTYDLYYAATSGLTNHALNDDTHDFIVYFCVNVGVFAIAVIAACLPYKDPTTVRGEFNGDSQ